MPRTFTLTFGEKDYEIPQLTYRLEQAWCERVALALQEFAPHLSLVNFAERFDITKIDELTGLVTEVTDVFNGSMATIGDLVISYLPPEIRQEVEANAYRDELIAALPVLIRKSLPLAGLVDLGAMIGLIKPSATAIVEQTASQLAVAPSAPASEQSEKQPVPLHAAKRKSDTSAS